MNAISRGNPLIGFASSLLYGFADTIAVYLQLYSKLDLKLIEAFPYLFILAVLIALQMFKRSVETSNLKRSMRLGSRSE